MRSPFAAVLIAALFTAPISSKAAIVTMGFDELLPGEAVLEYYNGGLGAGTGPGPALGVSFSPEWVADAPDVYSGDYGNSAGFSGTAIINFHDSWQGIVSFYDFGSDFSVIFYDQEDGLGQPVGAGSFDAITGEWLTVGFYLPTFRSAVFVSSGVNRIDALTSGAQVIPEPGTLSLYVMGVFSLTAGRVFRSKRARVGRHARPANSRARTPSSDGDRKRFW